jgi:hypothetical protein
VCFFLRHLRRKTVFCALKRRRYNTLLHTCVGQRPAGEPGRWARARRSLPERSRRVSWSRGGGAAINNVTKMYYHRDINDNRYQDFFVLSNYCSISVNIFQD